MSWFKRGRSSGEGLVPSDQYERAGRVVIDVRGQTCPGYLLSIERAVARLASGTEVELIISYPPCADDVAAWCRARGHELLDTRVEDGVWRIRLRVA